MKFATSLALLATLLLTACAAPEQPVRPNVLFLAVDDLNDWTGCLRGHPQAQTPNIDRLASRGVLFTNAHCPAPLCNPSRSAIFTGVRGEITEVYSNSDRLNDLHPGLLTLPEHFRAHGYRTLTAGKTFPVGGAYEKASWDVVAPGSTSGGPQGGPFTKEEYNRTGKPKSYLVERLGVTRPLSGMYDRRDSRGGSFDWGPFDLPDNAFTDGKVTDWVVEQLANIGDEPFFFAAGMYRPHQPLYAPRKYFELFPPESAELPETRSGDLDDLSEAARYMAYAAGTSGRHSWVIEADQWPQGVAAYLACVNFVDTQIGRILAALEEGGKADNTIIVLWSDHGWHLGEKEHWGKATGWEESTRVPLTIVLPESMRDANVAAAFAAGREYKGAANLVDLYPTVVELAGLPPVDGLSGRSLVPALTSGADDDGGHSLTTFGRGNYTIAQGVWRYIHYFDGSEELYNQASDPNQYENLAGRPEHNAIKAELKGKIPDLPEVEWIARWRSYKLVQFTDPGRQPLLYNLEVGESVTDRIDIAAEQPDLIAKIRAAASQHRNGAKYLTLPD